MDDEDFKIEDYPSYRLCYFNGKKSYLCKLCGVRIDNPETVEKLISKEIGCLFCKTFNVEQIKEETH